MDGVSAPHEDHHQGAGDVTPVVLTSRTGLRAMLQLSPDAVLLVDTDGRIEDANDHAARLLGLELTTLIGTAVDDFVPEPLRSHHTGHRDGYAHAPTTRTMGWGRELRAVRPDASTFPVDISLQPVVLHGQPLVLAVIRDITTHHELQTINEELADTAESLRRFVSLAAHELRTPLTSVRGLAETLLVDRATDPQLQRQVLERILANARRQEDLITNLLDLSRIEGGRLHVTPHDIELSEVVAAVLAAVSDERITGEVAPAVVRADPARLEQVLTNLLTNALRYGAPPITVTSTRSRDAVTVTVRDEGSGVDPAFAPRLFEAFAQQHAGTHRDVGGLGLGLYLTRELLHAMGGTITYRREPGATCFDVQLRRVPEGAAGHHDVAGDHEPGTDLEYSDPAVADTGS